MYNFVLSCAVVINNILQKLLVVNPSMITVIAANCYQDRPVPSPQGCPAEGDFSRMTHRQQGSVFLARLQF
jgi:hypothetical protein